MKNKILIPGILVILGILFYTAYYYQLKHEKGYVLIKLNPISIPTGVWGYEILVNGTPYIEQKLIPAVSGFHSFKSKEHAITVGNKVIEKMKEGQQLPSVTIQELAQMGVLQDTLP